MKELIENLYPINACLLGEGYDSRLEYLKHLLKLDVLEFKSGEQHGTWTIPDEWIVRDAWVKYKGKKILDYKKNPLSLVVGSLPFSGTVTKDELNKHMYRTEKKGITPYVFKYYDKDWGFCGISDLKDGDYEVFIDTEYKPGVMKIGVHTIPGKSDREILLLAHLDHPFQANDNLSAVACLVNIANKIKADHTVKIIFCPETLGSNVYVNSQDVSKVDFVIAVDICGNDNTILFQKSWNPDHRINAVTHCAFQIASKPYRKGKFRTSIGSDESAFNDPDLNIPGIMLSTWDYEEYHTSDDTPDKINYEKIEEVGDIILKTIEIYEKDYIPKKEYIGQLMRSRYNIQSPAKIVNLNYDYLFYSIDGKRSLAELCSEYELNFETIYDIFEKIIDDKKLSRSDASQIK